MQVSVISGCLTDKSRKNVQFIVSSKVVEIIDGATVFISAIIFIEEDVCVRVCMCV